MRPTVDAFRASDGAIYFLRGGTDAEHVLADPHPAEARLLELLHVPRTRDELADALGEAALVDQLLDELRCLRLIDVDEPRRPRLAPDRAARFDRQLAYFADAAGDSAGAEAAQERLAAARVTIIGCGGLGSWTAAGLACAGIGHLVLVDDDTVELSNLNRQILFSCDDVGARKVEVAAPKLSAFDPRLNVVAVAQRVASADDIFDVARGADLIVGTADSPPYEIARWINSAALRLGIPHVHAAQFPPYVRVGPLFRPGVTGCLSCQEHAARRDYPDYDAVVAYRQRRNAAAATLGSLSGLVGSILSNDAIHLLTGLATPATEATAIVIDGRDLTVHKEPVRIEPECEMCRPSPGSGAGAGRSRSRPTSLADKGSATRQSPGGSGASGRSASCCRSRR